LVEEFGAASLLGSGKSTLKYTRARDYLSDKPQLNKSRAPHEARVHGQQTTRASATWICRERNKSRDKTTTSSQTSRKKRIVGAEVDHSEVLEKRFQASLSEGKTPFVVAGADVQPRQQQ